MSDLPVSQSGPSEPPQADGPASLREQETGPEGGPLTKRVSTPMHRHGKVSICTAAICTDTSGAETTSWTPGRAQDGSRSNSPNSALR